MVFISEADVVAALLDQLEGLGYTRLPDSIAGPDGSVPERASYSDVVLMDRLKRAVDRLNPDIPSEARQDALKKIIADETPSLIEENRRIHRALVEGKYLRDALPNASFIGFTGTPIEKDDANTPAVFGQYIDVYDISRAVEDGATVPIYYESRLARIELPDEEKPRIDAEIEELTEDEAITEQERLKRKWSTVEALVGAEKRLKMVAEDLVRHFEARVEAMEGKAMVVCMSRRICVALYKEIIALRPDWHSDDDNSPLKKALLTGFHSTAKHNATKAVSPSSETMRTI